MRRLQASVAVVTSPSAPDARLDVIGAAAEHVRRVVCLSSGVAPVDRFAPQRRLAAFQPFQRVPRAGAARHRNVGSFIRCNAMSCSYGDFRGQRRAHSRWRPSPPRGDREPDQMERSAPANRVAMGFGNRARRVTASPSPCAVCSADGAWVRRHPHRRPIRRLGRERGHSAPAAPDQCVLERIPQRVSAAWRSTAAVVGAANRQQERAHETHRGSWPRLGGALRRSESPCHISA